MRKLQQKTTTLNKLLRFTLVGILNTLLDLFFLYLLIFSTGIATGKPYTFFKTISGLLVSIHSYLWHKYWTFEKKENGISLKEYSKFLAIISTGMIINISVASVLVNVIGTQFNISETLWAGVGALCGAIASWNWNFWVVKRVVFNK